jgi:hypothetical protein
MGVPFWGRALLIKPTTAAGAGLVFCRYQRYIYGMRSAKKKATAAKLRNWRVFPASGAMALPVPDRG